MFLQPKLQISFKRCASLLVVLLCIFFNFIHNVSGNNIVHSLSSEPICIGSGLYGKSIIIKGRSGAKWKTFESYNLFDSISLPSAKVVLQENLLLRETVINDSTSLYTVYCTYYSGSKYVITLINKYGSHYTIKGGGEEYKYFSITGNKAPCTSSIQQYTVPFHTAGYFVTVTGGTIVASNPDSSAINILWTSVQGVYKITFMKKGLPDCYNEATSMIAVGNISSAMACKAKMQISLDEDCAVEITPQMITAYPISIGEPYNIELYHGNTLLTNNVLSDEHIGKSIIAKLIQGCSENSCWSSLNIEDKTPPKIICRDTLVVNCYSQNGYKPVAIDNCNLLVNAVLVDSIVKNAPCHKDYSSFINTAYIAQDHAGNVSKTCYQIVALKRVPIDSVDFPDDVTFANALSCSKYATDEHGMPSPEVAGYPNYDCMDIHLNQSHLCNIYASYMDNNIGHSGCVEKILRKWTLVEWVCDSSNIRTSTQLIHIKDDVAPKYNCPKDKTVSSDNHNCLATVALDSIYNVNDECSSEFTFSTQYPGSYTNVNGGQVTLSGGMNAIIYQVSDQCGNSTTCTQNILVEDLTPPVMICRRDIVVAINSEGVAYLYASSVDGGSYDHCGLDSIKIRNTLDTLDFNDKVWFDCEEVGKTIMIELRAWNSGMAFNSCMANILVQDKNTPSIICPPNVTISCEEKTEEVDLNQYGTAIGSDACNFDIKEKRIENINQCGIGYIQRTFTIYDSQDSASCTSYVYIEKEHLPIIVTWPKDFEVKDSCSQWSLSPEKLPIGYNKPVIKNAGFCDLFGMNFQDKEFNIEGSAGSCYKIIRTWTVLDYCRMNDPEYEPILYQQVIKVSNSIDPILMLDVDTISCSIDNDCDSGYISLRASANDDCTPAQNLSWTYQIDYDYNGLFKADFIRSFIGGNADASDEYPLGTHRIIFTVEDKCGNVVSRAHTFLIKNCKAPTPICKSNVSITLNQMTINGQNVRMACINASSLNASSSHTCGYDLNYSFSRDINDTLKCFDCTDLGSRQLPLFVTDILGNAASCLVVVEIEKDDNAELVLTATKSQICNGESVTLDVQGSNMQVNNYLWNTGETTPTITVMPNQSSTYSVSVNVNEACVLTKSIIITVLPKMNVLINGDNSTIQNICLGDTINLSASGGLSYRWSNNQTGSSIMVRPTANTLYSVTATDANGCTASVSKTITVNPKPQANIEVSSTNVCPGESVTLTASGGATYNWSNGINSAINIVSPPINTIYTVTVTTNGCSVTASKEITLKQSPTIMISGDNEICVGSSSALSAINLESNTGNTFLWNTGQTVSTINVTPSTSGNSTYIVTITNAIGCAAVQSFILNVYPLPVISITPENPGVCPGAGAVLTASGGLAYTWNTIPPTNTAIVTVNPLVPTFYTVTVTSSQGCSTSSSKQVVISTIPNAAIAASTTITCQGNPTTLTASGGVAYEWNTVPVQSTAVITVTPSANTTYIVTVTNGNGCTNTASQTITVLSNNFATIAPATVPKICIGTAVTLTAAGGGAYLWNNGASTASITVSPTETFTYIVTVTNNGCTSVASKLIEVEPMPVALITGNTSICEGGFTTLTATNLVNPNGNIYTWSNGAVTPSITVAPVNTTIYTVTILNNGCGGMNNVVSATVTVNPPISASVTGPSQICQGQSATLTASGGATYKWNTVPPLSTASITVSPIINTIYTVTVTASPGCTAVINKSLTVLPSPIAFIQGDDNICQGTSTLLTATNIGMNTTGVNTYMWNTTPPQNTQSITVSPSTATIYVVTITNVNGCNDIDSITVTINPMLNPNDISCKEVEIPITNQGSVSVHAESLITIPGTPCDIEGYAFSYSQNNINDTIRIYNCDSLGQRKAKVFFYFNGASLVDSCIASLTITDPPSPGNPNGFCTNNIFKLVGTITTEAGIPVQDVSVNLKDIQSQITDQDGEYEFPSMQAAKKYMVLPIKDHHFLEGVTTMDLILIQRHILNTKKLTSPYKMIAADINNDGKISVLDLVELRKTIIGSQVKFDKNTSWKMIEANYKFADPLNPFNDDYPQYQEFFNPSGNCIANFIGVKIGDVNESYYSKNNTLEALNSGNISIKNSPQENKVGIKINNLTAIDGLQMSLNIEEGSDIYITSEYLRKEDIAYQWNNGKLKIVLLPSEMIVNPEDDLFVIHNNSANKSVSLDEQFINEIYADNSTFKVNQLHNEVKPVTLLTASSHPNPWSEKTTLNFDLDSNNEVQLVIRNTQGHAVFTKKVNGNEGRNSIIIHKDEVQSHSGILIYELLVGKQITYGKMLFVK